MNIPFPSKTFSELTGKSIAVWDYEANGLLPEVTKTNCAVIKDPRGMGESHVIDPSGVNEAHKILENYDILVGQNIIGYDLPMLKKIYNWEPKESQIILDTLWMSKMYFPDIEGGHSAAAWGKRLGHKKIKYTPPDNDWNNYDEDQLIYCEGDVDVTINQFNKLLELLANFSWKSIVCEMKVASIIQRQMTTGFVFDFHSAEQLYAELSDREAGIEDRVRETFKPIAKFVKEVQPRVTIKKKLSSVGLGYYKDTDMIPVPEFTVSYLDKHIPTSGAFSRIEWQEFSLSSRPQIANRLTLAGYKLTKFTPTTEKGGGGNPIIDDVVLKEAVDSGILIAKPLAEYFLVTKRKALVHGCLDKAELKNGLYRIHGYVDSLGATTNRMTHSSPNVAQTPATHKDKAGNHILGFEGGYGHEFRDLFTTKAGYTLVGCDADGLELRCLAHYMGDKEYAETIIHGDSAIGTDVHSVNMRAAGLSSRDLAKTFIYAFLYGAGDKKIGSITGGTSKDGKRLKERFLRFTPKLAALKARINGIAESRNWIRGIDGRVLRIRHAYAALNTLLQGMGAVVMKYWVVEVARVADKEGLDWNPVANIHDEGQFEVLNAHVTRFSEICEQAFLTISEDLELKCLCTGSAISGTSWAYTH